MYYWKGKYHSDSIELRVDGGAFRYGFGLFETLYWNGTSVCRLSQHLKRLYSSLNALGVAHEKEDFAELCAEVAVKNGLNGKSGRVNIIYPVDDDGPARAVVLAEAYAPPEVQALELALSPRPLHTWLGAHKSMNYLYYHLEHRAALQAGAHGAVVVSPDGHVLEAAHAALVFHDGQSLVTPAASGRDGQAPGLLPSTALEAAQSVLTILPRVISVSELGGFHNAWALNSLMGMKPVARVGDIAFDVDLRPCMAITSCIHSKG